MPKKTGRLPVSIRKKLMDHKKPSLPSKTYFFILAGVLIFAFIVGGYAFYRHEATAVQAQKYDELKAIADLKIRQIISWRQEREADARIRSTGLIRTDVLQWLKAPENDPLMKTRIINRLQSLRKYQGYENIILAGTDGRILVSLDPAVTELEPETQQLGARAVFSRNVAFGDFFQCSHKKRIHLDVAAPVPGEDDLPAAVLILRTDPTQYLYPLIQTWPMPSKTAEALIVRKDGDDVLFLNTLRHRPDPPLTVRIPLSRTDVPAVQAALGLTGLFQGHDYRGVDVLADIRPVPGSAWFMVAKADTDEILAEVRYRGGVIGIVTLILVLLAGSSAGYLYKHQGKRAFKTLYQFERDRRKAEELFKITLYSIGDAVITTDVEGKIQQMNPVAEKLTGWTESSAKGRPAETVFRIISEITGETVDSPVQKVLEKRMNVGLANHTLLIAKDGTQIPIADSGAPIRDESGVLTGVVLVFRDQTRERSAEAALRKENEFSGAIINSLPGVFYLFDENGHLLRWNRNLEIVSGYSSEEMEKVHPLDFFSGEEKKRVEEAIQEVFVKGESRVEANFISKEGRSAPYYFTGLNFILDNRPHVVGMGIDITERKTMEDQFRQAQKMESVGRLASGVAHDFNNMLMVIIGYTELVMGKVDPGLPIFKDLQEILNAAKRSANLTRQLLAFARKQIIRPVVLDLNDTISSMLKLLRQLIGEDIDLAWKPGLDIWTVKMDPAQIDQILANLLVNAKDAIGGVGSVTIETENVEFDEIYCAQNLGFIPGKYVRMAVSDTGVGMDKNILGHLFEPFFTTKELGKGTGLGLATVYGIVKQNNGFINVYSEPGQGTTVKIYLPRTESCFAEEAVAATGKNLLGTETVLLVEDEASILELGTSILTRYGYTVLSAKSPFEAVILANNHDGPIHLLVTDVVMPKMDGKELKERLCAVRPGIRCLFMSGYTANAIAHHGVLDKDVYFLQKPFSVIRMAEKVREALDFP